MRSSAVEKLLLRELRAVDTVAALPRHAGSKFTTLDLGDEVIDGDGDDSDQRRFRVRVTALEWGERGRRLLK